MKILLTGASGFIGRHLLPHLMRDHEVFALLRRAPDPLTPGLHPILFDLSQPLDTRHLPTHLDVFIPDEQAIPYYRANLVADISRMQTLLGFTPQVSLPQGISELGSHLSA